MPVVDFLWAIQRAPKDGRKSSVRDVQRNLSNTGPSLNP